MGVPGSSGTPGTPGQTVGAALLSGGGVAWVEDYDYVVAAATYMINGTRYTSPETSITLAAADGTHPRIDVIALTSSGTAVKIDGTAAANPAEASVDPLTQLRLISVYVGAGTTAATIGTTSVYAEDTEWTSSDSGATVDMASTSNPHAGTKCVEVTAGVNGNYAQLTDSAPFDTTTRNALVFYIRSKAQWANQKSLVVQWTAAGVAKGLPVTIKTGAYGFNSGTTGAYQIVVIPLQAFGVGGVAVDGIRFTVTGGGSSIGFYLDDISMQGGIAQVAATDAMRWKGAYSAAVQYQINDVVTYGGGIYRADATTLAIAPPTSPWSRVDPAGTQTLADAATVAWDVALGAVAKVTLGGNRTLGAPTNLRDGASYILRVIQDGTGSRTLAYNAVFKFPGGTDPVLSTVAGSIDILTFVSDGTNLYGAIQKAFA